MNRRLTLIIALVLFCSSLWAVDLDLELIKKIGVAHIVGVELYGKDFQGNKLKNGEGILYVTKYGLLHQGELNLLIQWGCIHSFKDRTDNFFVALKTLNVNSILQILTGYGKEKIYITPGYRFWETITFSDVQEKLEKYLAELKPKNLENTNCRGEGSIVIFEDFMRGIGEMEKPAKKAAETKKIAIGMTVDEVKAILGEPQTIIDLGVKVILKYEQMNVIFKDGKMVDAEVK